MKLTVLGCRRSRAERSDPTVPLPDDDIRHRRKRGRETSPTRAPLRIDHSSSPTPTLDQASRLHPLLVDTVGDERQRPITPPRCTRDAAHPALAPLSNWLSGRISRPDPIANHPSPALVNKRSPLGDDELLWRCKHQASMPAHHTVSGGRQRTSSRTGAAGASHRRYHPLQRGARRSINALPNPRHLIIEAAFPDAL